MHTRICINKNTSREVSISLYPFHQMHTYMRIFHDLMDIMLSGLDPALPLFYTTYFNRRLSQNDAEFVDVIHTNAMIQGQLAPCGHVDFYVNGGMSQPACHNSSGTFGLRIIHNTHSSNGSSY